MFQLSQTVKTVLKKKVRVGRGEGSHRGKNAGKGHKGQTKRGHVRIGFEGGQKTLIRRTPKFRGFKAIVAKNKHQLTTSLINQYYSNGEAVSLVTLREKKLIEPVIEFVRIVKNAELQKKVTFEDAEFIYLTKGVKSSIS